MKRGIIEPDRAPQQTRSWSIGWSLAHSVISHRYYEYHHSRAGAVVKSLIGDDFGGVLDSDLYADYNIHQGLHQRCWVHFLRNVHEIKEKYPHDEQLRDWTTSVKVIYEQAVAWAEQGAELPLSPRQQQARSTQQHAFEQQLAGVPALCAHGGSSAYLM